ncbi:MAG: class I SAM-dependent methyltransferase [Bacteroidetes bacterium]|nr:class I SAM-dependent methyltransferase [Bacteroidota bacterium]
MATQTPFDNYALHYDADFTNSTIGSLQRKRVWHYLNPLLVSTEKSNKLNILEINCGTGEDTVYMAKFGHTITATDASSEMIAIAAEKIKQHHFDLRANAEQCSFHELHTKFEGKQFDLILSDFGGLNCINEPDLKKTLNTLHNLLKPGGKIALTIMGTCCIWEVFYFSMKLQLKKAFRRLNKKGVETIIKNSVFNTYYHSPKKIKQFLIFNSHFLIQKPIGLFIPPSYLEPFFKNKEWLLKLLGRAENLSGRLSIFSNLADHYFITLEKKQ